jgi:hypothetical protein
MMSKYVGICFVFLFMLFSSFIPRSLQFLSLSFREAAWPRHHPWLRLLLDLPAIASRATKERLFASTTLSRRDTGSLPRPSFNLPPQVSLPRSSSHAFFCCPLVQRRGSGNGSNTTTGGDASAQVAPGLAQCQHPAFEATSVHGWSTMPRCSAA